MSLTSRSAQQTTTLARYRRACDYLAAAMIYLRDNVLLTEPLRREHLKPRPLGHWGTCPGLTLVYSALNSLIARTGQRTLLVTGPGPGPGPGPGHGAPAIHANLWLEGAHALSARALSVDGTGLVACVVGDGEAETGPNAASWHTPKCTGLGDGRVLPILHLNGYKISSPTSYEAMPDDDLVAYFTGCGWSPLLVDVRNTEDPDSLLAGALDLAYAHTGRPAMIILRDTKGAGAPPKSPDGTPLAGEPADVVLACAGTTPTVETLAAAQLLAKAVPALRVRVVNVVGLLALSLLDRHPNGMTDGDFAACFGDDVPVIFAFHGYPSAVHEVLHGRPATDRFHVHGYLEEGTTTPFDLLALNDMTRHDLAADVVSRAPGWSSAGGDLAQGFRRQRGELRAQSYRDGEDPPEITGWRWSS